MKSTKLVLIVAILSFAFIGTTVADGFTGKNEKKVINLTFEQAVQNPALVYQMHLQLDDSFLGSGEQMYTASVAYENYIVRITGSYDQWTIFFRVNITVEEVEPDDER